MDLAHSSPTTNQKRQHENETDSFSPRKIQRILDDSQVSPTKITDLNDVCLERTFGHLNFHELFNVAVANEYLRPTAAFMYKRKFGTIQVCIQNGPPSPHPIIFDSKIYVNGLKMCLQYLRCLGPSISNLCIRYDDWTKNQCDHIHQYISEYCSNSLVTIEMRDKPTGMPIKHFDKPFANVRTVKVLDCYLTNQFPSFHQWFTNVRALDLIGVQIGWFGAGAPPFQHLNDLHIEIDNGKRGFKTSMVARLLQLCPQLRNLTVRARTGTGITPTTLSKIINSNPNLCKLKVNTKLQKAAVTSLDVQQLAAEHPSLVELEMVGFKFTADAVMLLIRQLTSLKLFRFQISYRVEYNRIVSQLDSTWQSSLIDIFAGDFYVKLQR